MDKNWLIRTKSNHILGPISKEKVVELYHNGSIKPDDEVCSGNGFWFFIRETDMVDRFILGAEAQTFNPISEAKDILTPHQGQPELSQTTNDDITLVGGINLSLLNEEGASSKEVDGTNHNPSQVEPVAPPTQPAQPESVTETVQTETQKKNNLEEKPKIAKKASAKRPLKKQSYLKYLGIIGFIFLFLIIYFRKAIIRSLFEGEMTSVEFSIINSASAQDVLPVKKKLF